MQSPMAKHGPKARKGRARPKGKARKSKIQWQSKAQIQAPKPRQGQNARTKASKAKGKAERLYMTLRQGPNASSKNKAHRQARPKGKTQNLGKALNKIKAGQTPKCR